MTPMTRWFPITALLLPGILAAQGTSSHPKAPAVPAAPALSVPAVRSSTLPNGVRVRLVEHRELPLVQVTLTVTGGSRLDAQSPGIATFMAGMLDEGAGSRDALALQSELAYLGASVANDCHY